MKGNHQYDDQSNSARRILQNRGLRAVESGLDLGQHSLTSGQVLFFVDLLFSYSCRLVKNILRTFVNFCGSIA